MPCAPILQLEEVVIEPGEHFERMQKIIEYGMNLWQNAEKYREARQDYDANLDLANRTKHSMRRICKTDLGLHPSSNAFLGLKDEDEARTYIVGYYFQIDNLDSLSVNEIIHQIPNLAPLIGMAKAEAERVQQTMTSINCEMNYYRRNLGWHKPVYGGISPDGGALRTTRRNTSSTYYDY